MTEPTRNPELKTAQVLVLGRWRPNGQGEFAICHRVQVGVVDFYEKQPLAPVEYAQAAMKSEA